MNKKVHSLVLSSYFFGKRMAIQSLLWLGYRSHSYGAVYRNWLKWHQKTYLTNEYYEQITLVKFAGQILSNHCGVECLLPSKFTKTNRISSTLLKLHFLSLDQISLDQINIQFLFQKSVLCWNIAIVHSMFGKYPQKTKLIELIDAPEHHRPLSRCASQAKMHNVPCIWFVCKSVTQPL